VPPLPAEAPPVPWDDPEDPEQEATRTANTAIRALDDLIGLLCCDALRVVCFFSIGAFFFDGRFRGVGGAPASPARSPPISTARSETVVATIVSTSDTTPETLLIARLPSKAPQRIQSGAPSSPKQRGAS
jgi:hypothetical protein